MEYIAVYQLFSCVFSAFMYFRTAKPFWKYVNAAWAGLSLVGFVLALVAIQGGY